MWHLGMWLVLGWGTLKVFSHLSAPVRAEQSHLLNPSLSHKGNPSRSRKNMLFLWIFFSASKAQKLSPDLPLSAGPGCWSPAQLERALPKNTHSLPAAFRGSQNPPHHCNPAIKANGLSAAKSKGCHRAQGNNWSLHQI